jgi:hypothetical protein
MYRILTDTMKGKLSLVILTTTIIMVSAATTIAVVLIQQYPQTAQASPCNGDSEKEYCTGYHDGTVQAHKDFKTGDDLNVDQHRCTGGTEYCNGYKRI